MGEKLGSFQGTEPGPLYPLNMSRVLYALQPSNTCKVHTDLTLCGDRFAEDYRIDTQTGQCMNAGWIFLDSYYYIASQDRAEVLCHQLWGMGLEEKYDDSCDDVYYTEWE